MVDNITDEVHKIEEEIRSSGLPLEIETTAILKEHGWEVRNQVYYMDKDEGKARSVDIVAHKAFFENFGAHDRLNISLVIECKKSVKPWVFFTSSKEGQPLFELPMSIIKNFATPELKYSINITRWMLKQMHYTSSLSKECAIISYEPFKKGRGREVLEATYQVTKALNYLLEFFRRTPKLIPIKPVFILYPAIVFDGHIFECEPQNGNLKLSQSNYVQFFVEMEQTFLIDIIGKEFLSKYLGIIDEEIRSLKEALK